MSNKRGRTVKRPVFTGFAQLALNERTKQNHEMSQQIKKVEEVSEASCTQDVQCIAKLLDQNVESDAHFATIIQQVNDLLVQREKKQP